MTVHTKSPPNISLPLLLAGLLLIPGIATAQEPGETPANLPPLAPTVDPGGYETPFAIGDRDAIELAWTGNGDPDNDPVTYWIEIWWWNYEKQQWIQFEGEWLNEPKFSLNRELGLQPNIHYAWRVAACDTNKLSEPWYSWSGYSKFRTEN